MSVLTSSTWSRGIREPGTLESLSSKIPKSAGIFGVISAISLRVGLRAYPVERMDLRLSSLDLPEACDDQD